MKWVTVFIAAFAAVCSFFSLSAFAQPARVEIQSIVHNVLPEGKEAITFTLSGAVVPKAFTMDGGNPRLVIDFPGSSYAGKGFIPLPQGVLATAIRIGLHQKPEQKVRVVVDLAKTTAIQHSLGEYAEADRTLTVTIATDAATGQQISPPEPKAAVEVPPAAGAPAVSAQPAATPSAEQPAPPVQPAKPQEAKEDKAVKEEKVVKEDQAVKEDNAAKAEPAAKEAKAEPPVQEKPAEPPQLLDITFDGSSDKGEMVLFHLNDFYPPTVSAVEKDRPQVLCDFVATVNKKVRDNIATKGKYVQRIRTIKQKKSDKVQVVLDLSPDRDYDLQQVFFKNDNLFVLIVNELPPEKEAVNDSAKEAKGQ